MKDMYYYYWFYFPSKKGRRGRRQWRPLCNLAEYINDLTNVEAASNSGTETDSSEEESTDDAIVYEKETILYKSSDYLGQKKTIHLNYDVNMLIKATAIHPDGSEEELVSFELSEL